MNRPGFRCKPNTSVKVDCNSCFCSPKGTLTRCTRKACLKKPLRKPPPSDSSEEITYTKEETRKPGFRCKPNTSVKVDCNSCDCGPKGTLTRCTKKGCVTKKPQPVKTVVKKWKTYTAEETRRPGFRCEPNTRFGVIQPCKNCNCGPNGKIRSCTGCGRRPSPTTTTENSINADDYNYDDQNNNYNDNDQSSSDDSDDSSDSSEY